MQKINKRRKEKNMVSAKFQFDNKIATNITPNQKKIIRKFNPIINSMITIYKHRFYQTFSNETQPSKINPKSDIKLKLRHQICILMILVVNGRQVDGGAIVSRSEVVVGL